MSIQSAYRRTPVCFAVLLAVVASAVVASALGALGAFTLVFLLQRLQGPDGPMAAVLLVCTALNIAIPAFVSCFSVAFNWHHSTSWRAPTFAFALCAILARIWFPFEIVFAPFVLGTGAIAWLLSCWFLRRKLSADSEHVIKA
jgi:ABC-type Fe3+-siderophore transport system permease subunit